ncbi:SMC-Scp complex subunit ScpB [Natranaerobius trueperi]|uniref:Segregation and condensation protein B n=1 Tax=Natranaerobius trueperi TaxID=759412 RepID=A0A226BYW9_9FIRM|nr:SMC-Scp complex subunit ScpB [Natranaerobius trueperi]OWZ83972.1 SMC-Scp complex subunit ScpB [Natranaerobius trueperi]
MEAKELKGLIIGILFTKGDAISYREIAQILEQDISVIREVIASLKEELSSSNWGVEISKVAGGIQLTSKPRLKPYIEKMFGTDKSRRLSQAALETLAIIAYRQPITRVEIEEIRGVKVDRVLYSLVEKELIESLGRKDVPGKPILFGTTKKFLLHFGLNSIDDLPRPEDFSENLFENVQ